MKNPANTAYSWIIDKSGLGYYDAIKATGNHKSGVRAQKQALFGSLGKDLSARVLAAPVAPFYIGFAPQLN